MGERKGCCAHSWLEKASPGATAHGWVSQLKGSGAHYSAQRPGEHMLVEKTVKSHLASARQRTLKAAFTPEGKPQGMGTSQEEGKGVAARWERKI